MLPAIRRSTIISLVLTVTFIRHPRPHSRASCHKRAEVAAPPACPASLPKTVSLLPALLTRGRLPLSQNNSGCRVLTQLFPSCPAPRTVPSYRLHLQSFPTQIGQLMLKTHLTTLGSSCDCATHLPSFKTTFPRDARCRGALTSSAFLFSLTLTVFYPYRLWKPFMSLPAPNRGVNPSHCSFSPHAAWEK